jgi:hypothetical protein
MKMSKWKNVMFVLALLLLGYATANAGVSFNIQIGSGDYYNPV